MLHVVTLLLLLFLLLVSSGLFQVIDRHWFEGALMEEHRVQPPRALLKLLWGDDDDESASVEIAATSIVSKVLTSLGVEVPYLCASLILIGVSGFLTLGLMGPVLWHRGEQDSFLLVVVVVGVVRTFFLLYDSVKRRSGRFLEQAENLVVDVGESLRREREKLQSEAPAQPDSRKETKQD